MIVREYYKQFYDNEPDNLDKNWQMSNVRQKLPEVIYTHNKHTHTHSHKIQKNSNPLNNWN